MMKVKAPFITIHGELRLRYPKNNNTQNVMIKQHNNSNKVTVDLEHFLLQRPTIIIYASHFMQLSKWKLEFYRLEIDRWLSGFLPSISIHHRFPLNSDLTVFIL